MSILKIKRVLKIDLFYLNKTPTNDEGYLFLTQDS